METSSARFLPRPRGTGGGRGHVTSGHCHAAPGQPGHHRPHTEPVIYCPLVCAVIVSALATTASESCPSLINVVDKLLHSRWTHLE